MFTVLIKTDEGDEWEWVAVSTFDADNVWRILGFPQRTRNVALPMAHGSLKTGLES